MIVMATPDIIRAHRHSIRHREEVLASERCGCFYCCAVFPPWEIKKTWRYARLIGLPDSFLTVNPASRAALAIWPTRCLDTPNRLAIS